jgi:hypothetical protein
MNLHQSRARARLRLRALMDCPSAKGARCTNVTLVRRSPVALPRSAPPADVWAPTCCRLHCPSSQNRQGRHVLLRGLLQSPFRRVPPLTICGPRRAPDFLPLLCQNRQGRHVLLRGLLQIALPRSATADDVWPHREGRVGCSRPKIVTSGTYTRAIVSVLSTHWQTSPKPQVTSLPLDARRISS